MFKPIALLCLTLACTSLSLSSSYAAGPKSGGNGGGGATKPQTFRWAGAITSIQPIPGGFAVTLGTSYYAVGTGLVNSATKIKLNGVSNVSIDELRLGDFVEMDVIWPSRVATKLQVTGVR